ncbi:MAG TPA: SDR family NAD(P)-dependent oxidoreductase, partial [bacterium]|nr:SDR family NAD(P)-dependent oxidoreductase [bacterium]
MDLGLRGRVAIVLASSKGLGRAIALGLAREGARLTICARGEDTLRKTEREVQEETGAEVLALSLDVARRESYKKLVEQTLQRFGQIDILVNNAG